MSDPRPISMRFAGTLLPGAEATFHLPVHRTIRTGALTVQAGNAWAFTVLELRVGQVRVAGPAMAELFTTTCLERKLLVEERIVNPGSAIALVVQALDCAPHYFEAHLFGTLLDRDRLDLPHDDELFAKLIE